MPNSEALKTLCDEIVFFMRQGITLDQSHIHFLSSTFNVCTRKELEDLKYPASQDELNLFLELAVSPDLIIMEKVEYLLCSKKFTAENEHVLSDNIKKKVMYIPILFPDEPCPISFNIEPETIDHYIKKLRITYSISSLLLNDMDQCLTVEMKIKTCVQLRQTECPMNERNESFLSLFFKESNSFEEQYAEYLNLALLIMVSSNEDKDLKEELISRLRSFQKTQEQIKAAEDMMKRNTMEALMLQGFRIPPSSPDIIEANITMLRHILSCLYGWLDMGDDRVSEIDLGSHDGNDSMENVIRLLS